MKDYQKVLNMKLLTFIGLCFIGEAFCWVRKDNNLMVLIILIHNCYLE